MARPRTTDHKISNLEAQWRFQDKATDITEGLDEAFQNVDQQRREKASRSILDFAKTYCIGTLLDNAPSELASKALFEMEVALKGCQPYCIELSRGSGKTTFATIAMLYLLAYSYRRFCVIISQNARSAGNILNDCWRFISEKDSTFSQDFPEICYPYVACNGSFRRKQRYNGFDTELVKNAGIIQFPRIVGKDGKDYPTSGAVITTRGMSGGIRGMKIGRAGRPDAVILDDLQTAESAASPEQVQKTLDLINKDIMNLSSKGKLAVCMTATPLLPEDLVEHIERDVNWKTTKYPAILKFPKDLDKDEDHQLWKKYFAIFDSESVESKPHTKSLEFYRQHQKEMDDGAIVFQPERYKESDGHISALQALLEKRHLIGNAAFQAELQLSPVRYQFSLSITPQTVISRISSYPKNVMPSGFSCVVASSDLNLSYAISTVIVAFKRDMTAVVLNHLFKKCNIDMKLSDTEYNQRVYQLLSEHGEELKRLGLPNLKWGIDCNGVPFDAVTSFCNNSMKICGIPACGMIGRASHVWSGYVRSRLKNAINRTVLCGDAQEQNKAGSGKKWIAFDTDMYREMAQKAFMSELGSCGSCCLYDADIEEHTEYATQFCNERLLYVKHRQDGRNQYEWKSKDPHDMLDATSQAFAICASEGYSAENGIDEVSSKPTNATRKFFKTRRRIKII